MSKPILLMNHTLISKKEWCETAPNTFIKGKDETWKQKADRELIEMLCRIPSEFGEAAEQGIKFENQVYKFANRPQEELKGSPEFKQVVEHVRGGVYQKFHTKDMELEDVTLRWYGALDVEFGNKIVDVKTTKEFTAAKYKYSGQDIIYRYLTGKMDFEYLVAQWDAYPKIKSVNVVKADAMTTNQATDTLRKKAKVFIAWLKDLGLYDLYVNCYSHNGWGWKSTIAKKGPEQKKVLDDFYKPFQDKYMEQFKTIDF